MAGDGTVIVKRIKRSDHDAHHGGAWKVAYADFVTAMMAFFLLMWLINTTTPEQKRGIADYFAAQSISQSSSGSGGVLGGIVLGKNGVRAGGMVSIRDKNSPKASADPNHSQSTSKSNGGSAAGSDSASEEQADNAVPSAEDSNFKSAAEAIHQAMQTMPDIAKLSRQVMVDQTPQGLRIQLVDQDGRPMFQPGTAELMPYTKTLLQALAKTVGRLPNRISISGHTDGQAFEGPKGMTNWELSADRANAARAVLTGAGVDPDHIFEVAGKAGSEPLLPDDPLAPANRRISIVLLREAPPVPPNHKL